MKKLLSVLLALTLVLSMSMTAFAADTSPKTGVGDNGSAEISVNGTYEAGSSATEVISVDISWGAMDFTYTGASDGTWNPSDHSYTGSTEAGWTASGNEITVTNHSNAGVTASLSFTASVEGITGTFSNESLNLATAVGTTYEAAPNGTSTFTITGGQIDADQTLGTITVSIKTTPV